MTGHVCTLDTAAAAARLPADRALAARVEEVERTPTGAVVRVARDDGTRRLVDTFISHEQQCCGVFDLVRTETATHVELRVDAPRDPAVQRLVDQLVHAMRLGAPDG